MNEMMKCGCAAQSVLTHRGGKEIDPPIPYCGLHECAEIMQAAPDLSGRTAKCSYSGCKRNSRRSTHYGTYDETGSSIAPSSPDLPFFQHRPDQPHDTFYCGCFGWD